MKRIRRSYLFLAFALLLLTQAAFPATAAKPDRITVAYCIDCVQFHFQNDQGEADGLIIDLWRLWSKKTGIEIDFKAASWEETLRMVREGEADAHAGLFFNDERNTFLEYGSSLTETETHFFVHKSLAGIETLEGLKDIRVGVLSGDFVEGYLKEKLPPENIFGFESYESIMSALKGGVLKAFAADTPTGLYHLQKAGLGFDFQYPVDKPLYSNRWFTAARKGNTELIGFINDGMALIDATEREAIERRWSLIIIQNSAEADIEGVREKLNFSEQERQWLAEHPVIRVHNEKDWPPFNFFQSGRPQGLSIDYMNLLAAKIGIKIEYISGPTWNDFLEMMKDGRLDVMLNIVKTEERQKYLLYTPPYADNPNTILSRQETPYDSLEQLFGKTISVPKGFFYEEILKRDYPKIKLYLAKNTIESMKAVSFGKADAALGELAVFNYLMGQHMMTGLVISGEVKMGDPELSLLNIATRKDLPLLISILRKTIKAVSIGEVRAIREKWLGGTGDAESQRIPFTLTAREKSWLAEHQFIRLGVDPAYPPFDFIADDGTYSGMASDYARLLGERLGVTLEVVPDLSWGQVIAGVKSGAVDVLPAVTKTPERDEFMNFSQEHLIFPDVLFMRDDHDLVAGLPDMKGRMLALVEGYATSEHIKEDYPTVGTLIVESPLLALQAVAEGKADGTVQNLGVATYLIKKHNLNNIVVAAPIDLNLPGLSFGVRKDWPELVPIIDKVLASITPEEEAGIREKWGSTQYQIGIDIATVRRVALQAGAVAALILIVIIVWNRKLNKEIKQRKRVEVALRESEEQISSAFETSTAGMFMHDEAGIFIKVNHTFCDLLGYSEQEILAMNWRNVIHLDDFEDTEAKDAAMASGELDNLVLEKRYLHKDGHAIWGRLFTSCLRNDDGSIKYIFCQVYDITDRKRAQGELAEKEAQLRVVMENAPGGIRYIDKDSNYVLFNEQYLELYGFPDDLLKVGEHYRAENIFQAERGDFGPGDPEKLTDIWLDDKPLATKPLNWERTTVLGKTLQVNTAPVPTGGVINIVTDVTDRKHAEQLMKEAKDHAAAAEVLLNDAIENISDGFVLYDPDDHLVTCNSKFMELYKYTDDDCYPGVTWLDLERFDTSRGAIERESESVVAQGQRRWDDFERLLADGRWLDIRQRKTASGGHVSIQVDITERKHAEELMQKAKDQAEQITDAKSEFIAVVSHEVRTPMNGVLGMARLLTETKLDEEQKEFADAIVASGESLISIINDLLDISKLDANKLEVESRPFCVNEVIKQSVALMKSRAREKDLGFTSETDSEIPNTVIGDPHRLRQILLNLISNAIKFTDQGSVNVSAALEEQRGESIVLSFSVTDTGKGIPPEGLEKLFSAYTQGSVEVARKYGGTGLGLTICRRLAVLMNGEISVESTVDEGSVFQFKAQFTLAPDLENVLPVNDQSTTGSNVAPLQTTNPLRVLQVEDNAINRSVIERALSRVGHNIVSAENGEEALKLLKEGAFDVILMDRHMPVMDGLKATRLIRELEEPVASIPIIGITAGAAEADIEACLEAGMNQCLTKPVDANRLRSILDDLYTVGSASSRLPVLVVDDVEINRAVASAQLKKLCYPFEVTESGEEALSKMGQGTFSLVLLDVSMPDMDGLECVRQIRAREQGRVQRTPVVAVTGNVSPQDHASYLKAGMDDVLTKPQEIDALKDVLEKWCPASEGTNQKSSSQENGASDPQTPASPIDLDRLARTLGDDDEDELFFMLGIFNDEFPKLLDHLESALVQRDARSVHDCAHAAKGAAANAAAPVLVDILKGIEKDAHQEQWEEIIIRTSAAKTEYSRIVQFCNERQ